MAVSTTLKKIPNKWDDKKAAKLSEPTLLLKRSNILGSDLRITNFAGGNTSAKITTDDPLTGKETQVLWVKGSGGDLGSMKLSGFSTLYMDKLIALKKLYRGKDYEDEMVDYYPHCTFNLNPRAASIDTPLHAYIPHVHVDHMHPDAIIAIAAAKNSEQLTREIFGDELGWLPWIRPGYELGLQLETKCQEKPHIRGIMLAGHGLFSWGETSKKCYENTLDLIQKAADYLTEKEPAEPFGGQKVTTLDTVKRRDIVARIIPVLRGKLSAENRKIGHYNDSPAVLQFVNSNQAREMAALGTSCPDHFLRTKIKPLFMECDPEKQNAENIVDKFDKALSQYLNDYKDYYSRCKYEDSPPLRDPYPVVILIPSIGMLTFAKDKATARISGEFYVNAINVIRGASSISEYVGLSEQEAFDIEYWALEEAKLKRMPKPKSLAGRVAYITGGAGGIGSAIANKMLAEGACVVLADIDEASLTTTADVFISRYGSDNVHTTVCNVTDEQSVIDSYNASVTEFGGIDILVSNAGTASSAPVEETSLEIWEKNMSILATGYFLVSRQAFRIMKAQGLDTSIIFVASKNGLAASPNASAYCTAKGSEIHLARCLALEGAEAGIRVNVVNPDAVLQGSKLWQGKWLKDRATSYNIKENEVAEHYRNRSMLKRSVHPEDIAEGVYFFASDKSYKSTGNILNVDAGNATAFTR